MTAGAIVALGRERPLQSKAASGLKKTNARWVGHLIFWLNRRAIIVSSWGLLVAGTRGRNRHNVVV